MSINDIFYYVLTFYQKQISSPLISLGSQIGKIINMETIQRIGLRINGFMVDDHRLSFPNSLSKSCINTNVIPLINSTFISQVETIDRNMFHEKNPYVCNQNFSRILLLDSPKNNEEERIVTK